jgi:hypothetical protein
MKKKLLAGAVALGAALAGGGCGSSCISRGTWVRVPGGQRRIEELEPDDEVICVDPVTGRLEPGRVAAISSVTRECIALTVGASALIVTSDHPLYCPREGAYHPAGDWALGQRSQLLQVTDSGVRPIELTAVSRYAGVFEVFDLGVDHPLHNFVANGLLVHNKQPPGTTCGNDAGTLFLHGDACTCQNGSDGVISCSEPGAPVCIACRNPDGGSTDGG